MKTPDYQAALNIRFDSDAGEGVSIRDYLHALLATLWHEEEGFSGKRPFGNSGWQYDLYRPLIAHKFIPGTLDEDGNVEQFDRKAAHQFVKELIHVALYGHPQSEPTP